jgi:hypothetical protein
MADMLFLFIGYLLLSIHLVNSIPIPFIQNVTLHTGYFENRSQLINGTCNKCLCMSPFSYSAINCYPNNTCQLFSTFPISYRIEATPGGRLYFPQQSFPNASQCCMPNINYLLNKLKMATMIFTSVLNPRDAVIDDYGYLVTVEVGGNTLDRFNPINLTEIDTVPLPNTQQMSIAYFQDAYYIAPLNGAMTVVDSENLTVLTSIPTQINGIPGIIFLNDGQTMVVTDLAGNRVVFFNRTSLVPIQYNISFYQYTNFNAPYGLWRVNDSFFYVTSYTQNSLYSFSATSIYKPWIQTLVLPSINTNGQGGAARVTIDECGRFWSTFEINTIFIHDQQGQYLGNWTIPNPNSNIFDIKIMDNYLIYLTDTNMSQIMRFDPGFECYF